MIWIRRAALAWLALLASGLAPAFTGEITWHLAGRELYGERFVFVVALGLAAAALFVLGRRSAKGREAWWFAFVAACLALLTAAGQRGLHQFFVWLLHVGLCAQLFAWWMAARTYHGIEKAGLLVMLAGMAFETFAVFPLAQLSDVDPACMADASVAMRLTCVVGSPYVSMALPALVSAVLLCLWHDQMLRAGDRRFGGGRRSPR